MDSAIPISAINDFLFCPKSLYLHSIYNSFDKSVYHDTPQTIGKIAHEKIEGQTYATSKYILQGMFVYSTKLQVKGKIDLYDAKNKHLIERKHHIKYIYDGYRYQLYAQMYCMEEIGFVVKRLFLHSLSDNKRYEIPIPTKTEKKEFENVLLRLKSFDADSVRFHSCKNCQDNIYGLLGW